MSPTKNCPSITIDKWQNADKGFFYKDLFYLYEYTVTVLTQTRRGHQIPLKMVASHYVWFLEIEFGTLGGASVVNC